MESEHSSELTVYQPLVQSNTPETNGFIYIIYQPDLMPNHVKLGRTGDYNSLYSRYGTPLPGCIPIPFMVFDQVESEKYLFKLAQPYHYDREVYKQATELCLHTQKWDQNRYLGTRHQLVPTAISPVIT